MSEVSGKLRPVLRLLQQVEQAVCCLAFALLVLFVFADVISRELTGAGLYWGSQLAVWANVFVVMAGFGLASDAGMHLRPRFADRWLPARFDRHIRRLQQLSTAVFCAGLASVSGFVTWESWRLGEISVDLFVPVWPVQAMLPLAFSLTAFRYLVYGLCPQLAPGEQGMAGLAGEKG